MKRIVFVCVFCAALVIGSIAFSQDENAGAGSIEGKVYLSGGQFLAYANVVMDDGSKIVHTALDGSYRIDGVKPGHHNLMCWKPGYFDLGREVTVQEGKTVTVDFPLIKRVPEE